MSARPKVRQESAPLRRSPRAIAPGLWRALSLQVSSGYRRVLSHLRVRGAAGVAVVGVGSALTLPFAWSLATEVTTSLTVPLAIALGSSLVTPVAMASAPLPTLELPPADTKTPLIQVAVSPQLELAALVFELASAHAPTIDTPARVDAYSNAGSLSQSHAIQLARQLEPQGLTREALSRYLLFHGPPPLLPLKNRVVQELLPAAEARLLRENKSDFKRFSESLRKLYQAARLDKLLERHQTTLRSAVDAYASAFPGDAPLTELIELSGEPAQAGPIFLVPSLLATSPQRLRVPLEHAQTPFRVSVLPVGDPSNLTSEAHFARYTEVAHWALEPVFKRFSRELQEASGIHLPITEQLARALYFSAQGAARPAEVAAWRKTSLSAGYSLIPALEQKLTPWLANRGEWPTLSHFMPELLEHASLVAEGKAQVPTLSDPGFERWNGAVLDSWTVEVVEPAFSGMPRPSNLARVRGEPRSGYALLLSGDKQTNEWQGVVSEPLPVIPGDKVTVTGRMRSQDVKAMGKRVTASHLEAKVLNRDGAVLRRVLSREFVGTTPWEDVKLEFVVPAGADRMHIAAVLVMVGELYVDNISLSVERPTVRRFLRNGGFETLSANAPSGWEPVVAARLSQSGPSVASRWELDYDSPAEGKASLKLAGDAQTSQWLEVRSTPVAVSPGQRVTLSGMTRSKGVTLAPRQHRHANLSVTFLSASGAEITTFETPALEGSSGWKPVELEVVAPLESVKLRVGALLTMSGEVWFDDVHLSRR